MNADEMMIMAAMVFLTYTVFHFAVFWITRVFAIAGSLWACLFMSLIFTLLTFIAVICGVAFLNVMSQDAQFCLAIGIAIGVGKTSFTLLRTPV